MREAEEEKRKAYSDWLMSKGARDVDRVKKKWIYVPVEGKKEWI